MRRWDRPQIQRRTGTTPTPWGDDTRSWFQQQPTLSLQMLDAAGVSAADSLVDVGGGASPLAGALLDRGFRDVTVLDISATGMQHAQRRLGGRASQVRWLVADVLGSSPSRGQLSAAKSRKPRRHSTASSGGEGSDLGVAVWGV